MGSWWACRPGRRGEMIGREALSLYVIRASMGLGGGLLAADLRSEAYAHGGFLVAFAVGVFVMIGLAARAFGKVRLWVYGLATLALTAAFALPSASPRRSGDALSRYQDEEEFIIRPGESTSMWRKTDSTLGERRSSGTTSASTRSSASSGWRPSCPGSRSQAST